MATKLSPTDAAKIALDTAIRAADVFLKALDTAQDNFPAPEPGITLAGQNDIWGMKHHVQMKLQEMLNSRKAYEPIELPQAGQPLPPVAGAPMP